jgi:hypothetical protein
LDELVRVFLGIPGETRTSVEARRNRWIKRSEILRQNIWKNCELLLEYQDLLRRDQIDIGRSIELSTSRILDIVLWMAGKDETNTTADE